MKATGIQNTYFLIKNLTERMVMTYRDAGLPLCILRPTIVTGVARAPYPGFVGNTSGVTGAFLATAVGAAPGRGLHARRSAAALRRLTRHGQARL
jgi:nucleoside-diphosphate-sugar epimerase